MAYLHWWVTTGELLDDQKWVEQLSVGEVKTEWSASPYDRTKNCQVQ